MTIKCSRKQAQSWGSDWEMVEMVVERQMLAKLSVIRTELTHHLMLKAIMSLSAEGNAFAGPSSQQLSDCIVVYLHRFLHFPQSKAAQ